MVAADKPAESAADTPVENEAETLVEGSAPPPIPDALPVLPLAAARSSSRWPSSRSSSARSARSASSTTSCEATGCWRSSRHARRAGPARSRRPPRGRHGRGGPPAGTRPTAPYASWSRASSASASWTSLDRAVPRGARRGRAGPGHAIERDRRPAPRRARPVPALVGLSDEMPGRARAAAEASTIRRHVAYLVAVDRAARRGGPPGGPRARIRSTPSCAG